jgi:tetratricopeptide (TPR) repeat protein
MPLAPSALLHPGQLTHANGHHRPAGDRATRHTWLALEIVLTRSSVQDCLGNLLSTAKRDVFRQQIDVLLDLLGQAGLQSDDPNVRLLYAEELRSARRTNLLWGKDLLELQQQADHPRLAHLLSLRSLWGAPLVAGMLAFFQRRSLDAGQTPEGEVPEGPADEDTWRCLERTARLLEKCEEEVVTLLDRSEESNGTSPANDREEAIANLYQRGLLRCQHGDYQQAIVHFTAALKLDPGNGLVAHQRGDAYRLLCQYERAIADFQAALRSNPSPATLVSRAIAYHLSGEHARAIADCTSALALAPDHAVAYRTRAAAYAESGDAELALADLTRVVALTPEDDEAYYLGGVIHARQRDFARAIDDFTRALTLNPYRVPALLHRAHARRRQGNQPQAIHDYSEVLRHHPTNMAAFSGRGLAYKLQGDNDRALADLTRALELGSRDPGDYCHRGVLYRSRGDLVAAQADFDASIRLQPENWPALYFRGKILLAQGQYRLAVLDLGEVVRLAPGFVAGYLNRALAHDRLGQFAEGIADATTAIERDGRSAAAYLVRGVVRAHHVDRAAAIADLTAAIEIDERLALAWYERSMLWMLQGDYDRALVDCDRFVALESANAQAYVNRSIVYHFKGEVAQALTDYSRALQIDPQRIMTGWNEPLAQNARSQATQRIIDYIDGLRHESPAEPLRTSEFRIVIELPPKASDAEKAPVKKADKPAKQPTLVRSTNETVLSETTAEEPPPQSRQAPAPSENEQEEEEETELTLSDEAINQAAEAVFEEEEEDSPDTPDSPADSAPLESKKEADEDDHLLLLPAPRPEKVERPRPSPAPVVQATTTTITCRNCNRPTEPVPVSEGRVRCMHCKSVFPLHASARPVVKKKEKQPPFLQRWNKALTITAGAAVVLVLVVIGGRSVFGNGGRLAVHRAQGKAEYEGKPMNNATIFLHPINIKDPRFPKPRAVVQEDGNFLLTTYRKDDGAPVGEYKVTVQWFATVKGSDLPTNVLPPRYAKAETSDLTVRIEKGDNFLPPIHLTKRSK